MTISMPQSEPVAGVVYVLTRPGNLGEQAAPSCDAVFRPLQAGGFRPRRRFASLEAAFRFLTREVGVAETEAAHTLEAGTAVPLYVQLSESHLDRLWPDWRGGLQRARRVSVLAA